MLTPIYLLGVILLNIVNRQFSRGFKKAATIIEYNHLPIQNRSQLSSYHILIGALSYYASCQYSKAFILLKDIQSESPIANLLNQFLSKNYTDLSLTLNEILINNEYASTKYLKILILLLAKSLSNLLSIYNMVVVSI